MLYPSSNPAGNQSTAPAIDVDHLYAMTVEPQLAYRKKPRYCKRCGEKLSGYNRGTECFHHAVELSAVPRRRVEAPVPKPKQVSAELHPQDRCLTQTGKAPRNYGYHLGFAKSLGYQSLSEAVLAIYYRTGSLRKTARKLGYQRHYGVRRYIMAAGGTLRPTGKPSRDAKIRRLAVGQ